MSDRTATRKPLPLSQRDLDDLNTLRSSARQRRALAMLLHTEEVDPRASEAEFLHAVWAAGMRVIRDMKDELGYAELAARMTEQDKAAQRTAVTNRRARLARQWDDE